MSSFYPEFNLLKMREELRKQTTHLELTSWKELHTFLKNSKLTYRVSLPEVKFFRQFKCLQSKILVYSSSIVI